MWGLGQANVLFLRETPEATNHTGTTSMNVGFIGTTEGMTKYQSDWVKSMMVAWGATRAMHSGKFGSEAQFSEICKSMGIPEVICIVGNTQNQPVDVGEMPQESESVTVHGPMPEDLKNEAMTRGCDLLLACPLDYSTECGTWRAVSKARVNGARVSIIPPEPEPA